MIPYNNSIIVPVDTGYGNIKNSLHSFPTGISAYKTKPAFEGKILHIGDMYYRIGEGHKEYIPDKTVDEEFRLLTIAAICDECRSCGYYEGNIFLEEAEKYCRKIFDALYRCEYDPDFMKLYVCGGGIQLIRRFGNYPSDRVIFIDDICATAKGYQQFALKSLKSLEKRSE